MKHVKLFEAWINEDEGKHSYGCVMLQVNFPLDEIQSQIQEEDVYAPDEDRSYGKETTPHVTLLYGIHDDETTDDEVFKCCEDVQFPKIRLHNVSCFENEKYDVLKFDADCVELHDANDKLSNLPRTNTFPDYHPHATIAYLKPGTGEKYTKMFKDIEYLAEPTEIEYSKANDDVIMKTAKRREEEKES